MTWKTKTFIYYETYIILTIITLAAYAGVLMGVLIS